MAAAPAAEALRHFLVSNGGETGGWDAKDHGLFLQWRSRFRNNRQTFVSAVCDTAPGDGKFVFLSFKLNRSQFEHKRAVYKRQFHTVSRSSKTTFEWHRMVPTKSTIRNRQNVASCRKQFDLKSQSGCLTISSQFNIQIMNRKCF